MCRATNWGAEPSDSYHSNIKTLVTEICTNTVEKKMNIWTLIVKFKEGGAAYEVDSRTKDYVPRNETFFERYMINYWGMGEDARVGIGNDYDYL